MGIEQNFRTSLSRREILDFLSDLYIENSPVMLWQNDGGKRRVLTARIDTIDLVNSALILKTFPEKKTQSFERIDSNLNLYILGESKNIAFKLGSDVTVLAKDRLSIPIPDEVKLQEKRSEPRIVFEEEATAEIYSGGKTDKSIVPTTVDLRDLSLSGMGFYLQNKSARIFYEKDRIRINRIGRHNLQRPIYGTIVYIVDGDRSSTHKKVGIRFVEKLTQDIIDKV